MTWLSNCRKRETGMGWALSIILRAASWLSVRNYGELMISEGAESHYNWEQHSGQIGLKGDCEINIYTPDSDSFSINCRYRNVFAANLGVEVLGALEFHLCKQINWPCLTHSRISVTCCLTQLKWDIRDNIVSWRMFLINF